MASSGWLTISGEFAVMQAPIFDGLSFDPFALFDDCFGSAEVGIGRCHVVQALVIALVVLMLDERFDLALEVAGQKVVFQQDAVLQGLVPAFDLTLRLRVERCATQMAHPLSFDIVGQFARDTAGAIVAQQPGFVPDDPCVRNSDQRAGRRGDVAAR